MAADSVGEVNGDRLGVVVVDDHPAVVAGIRLWCAETDRLEVVAGGPTPAVAWTSPGSEAAVVVLDLQLRGMREPGWGELTRLVAAGRRVIVYSMRDDERTVLRSLDIGCATYLTKAEGEAHLVAAVLAAVDDQPYLSPALAGAMTVDRAPDRPRLTERESQVLLAWFQCESKEVVAEMCGLSPRTVSGYLDRVRIRYARVGRPARTKASLVARALQDGLIGLDDL